MLILTFKHVQTIMEMKQTGCFFPRERDDSLNFETVWLEAILLIGVFEYYIRGMNKRSQARGFGDVCGHGPFIHENVEGEQQFSAQFFFFCALLSFPLWMIIGIQWKTIYFVSGVNDLNTPFLAFLSCVVLIVQTSCQILKSTNCEM